MSLCSKAPFFLLGSFIVNKIYVSPLKVAANDLLVRERITFCPILPGQVGVESLKLRCKLLLIYYLFFFHVFAVLIELGIQHL